MGGGGRRITASLTASLVHTVEKIAERPCLNQGRRQGLTAELFLWPPHMCHGHMQLHLCTWMCITQEHVTHSHTHTQLMWEMIIKLDSAFYGPESISRMCHMFISSRILGYEGTGILKPSRREKCFVNLEYKPKAMDSKTLFLEFQV